MMALSWPRILVSALGSRGAPPLSIFIFHRVRPRRDPLFPNEPVAAEFDAVMGWIKEWFEVLPLAQATRQFPNGTLTARAACITFDDGYADNFTTALPILQRHRVSATFFIATGFLNGGRMWNDTVIESVRHTRKQVINLAPLGLEEMPVATISEKQQALHRVIAALKHRSSDERADGVAAVAEITAAANLPNDLMMTDSQLRQLSAAGMGIGAHTVTHPILAKCDEQSARREIEDSRSYLESLLGEHVTLFAYPNGKFGDDYTSRDVDIVRELGFTSGVSTNPGASRVGDDPFQLRRFTPWDRQRTRFALRLAQNLLRRPSPSAEVLSTA